ncbi:hypothetical protein GWK47_036678 [Chionoecetes opilio]|uniref:Uncharacterized protein n=1 Tax=Chionoecetes opilio TaxID=41210 RepID=A0A8J4YE95_CHIOP|nr:hypothetical protein GWK47_036678 [Chionoecetes opilio]
MVKGIPPVKIHPKDADGSRGGVICFKHIPRRGPSTLPCGGPGVDGFWVECGRLSKPKRSCLGGSLDELQWARPPGSSLARDLEAAVPPHLAVNSASLESRHRTPPPPFAAPLEPAHASIPRSPQWATLHHRHGLAATFHLSYPPFTAIAAEPPAPSRAAARLAPQKPPHASQPTPCQRGVNPVGGEYWFPPRSTPSPGGHELAENTGAKNLTKFDCRV